MEQNDPDAKRDVFVRLKSKIVLILVFQSLKLMLCFI